jgi:Ca2+-binding EF-hand superfamily protein
MGAGPSLEKQEAEALHQKTGLSVEQIDDLHQKWVKINKEQGPITDRQKIAQTAKEMGLFDLSGRIGGNLVADDAEKSKYYGEIMLRVLDTSGDHLLSFEEMITGFAILSKGTPVERAKLIFKMYDKDGDGFVSRTELLQDALVFHRAVAFAAMSYIGWILSPVFSREEFQKGLDSTFDENDVGVRALIETCFELADSNHDGKISEEEFIKTITTPNFDERWKKTV